MISLLLRGSGSRCRSRGRGRERLRQGSQTFVLLAGLLDHAAGDKVLKLLVSSQAKHLLSTTRCIASPETFVHHIKELLELERGLFRESGYQLLRHEIGKPTGKRTFSLHKGEKRG